MHSVGQRRGCDPVPVPAKAPRWLLSGDLGVAAVEGVGGEPVAEQINIFYTRGIIPRSLYAVKFAFGASIAYTGAGGR